MKFLAHFVGLFVLLFLFNVFLVEGIKEPKTSACDGTWTVTNLQGQTLTSLLKAQSLLLEELRNKLSKTQTELDQLKQDVNQKTNKNQNDISLVRGDVSTLTQRVNRGVWPSGHYCILSKGGSCPAGFIRSSGHMRAISLYAGSSTYITPITFGDSKIKCHGRCGQYGHWTGELYIVSCCK